MKFRKILFWVTALIMLALIFAPIVLCYLCPSFTGYSMQELAELMWTDEEITDKALETTMINVLVTLHVGIAAITCLSLVMRSIIGMLGSVGVTVWIYFLFGKLWSVFVALGVGVGIMVLPLIVSAVIKIFTDIDAVKIVAGIFSAIAGFAVIGLGYLIYTLFNTAHWFITTLNIIYCVIAIICILLTWGTASENMEARSNLLEMQLVAGMARAHNRRTSTDDGRFEGGFNAQRDAELRSVQNAINNELKDL